MIGLMTAWTSLKRIAPIAAYALIALLIGLCSHFAHRAAANADAMRDQARQFSQAQVLAAQAAKAERDRVAADYATKAMEAQNAYQSEVASARDALGQYIAAHRLRPATAARGAGSAGQSAAGGDPRLSESVSTGAVVVSQADLQACTDSVSYAQKAHDWAISLDQHADANPGP